MEIRFDKYSLIVDGKRKFIRSGAFHYFRTPGAELAKDRFLKLKAAGYNTVDIYFYWNYHSKKQGQYDFSDIKDVEAVLKCAQDVGLFVIARPGPFINAEVNAGGFPFWVLQDKNVIPRNRILADYQYSPEYMALVNEWYDQIIPIINKFDNVVAFQIENEYATNSMEEDYMRELYEMARSRGIKCPIFHNDAYCAGLWADVVDIYACDTYPYINPNQNWKQDHFCFDTLDNLEEMVRSVKEDAPIFIAEMQAGWFDKWDGKGYEFMRDALGEEHINIVTKTALSQGLTMFNHYMAIGGTSWDDIACDEVYTSYEFTAPIDEYGLIQPNYYRAKEINYFLKAFGFTQTEPVELDFYEENIYTKLRRDLENNCQWLFVRNMNPEPKTINIPVTGHQSPVTILPYAMKICPVGLELKACTIDFSDMEIFGRIKNEHSEIVLMIIDENANALITPHSKIPQQVRDDKDSRTEEPQHNIEQPPHPPEHPHHNTEHPPHHAEQYRLENHQSRSEQHPHNIEQDRLEHHHLEQHHLEQHPSHAEHPPRHPELVSGSHQQDFDRLKFEKDGKTTEFVFLSRETANKTWIIKNEVIFGADFVYPNGTIALSESKEIAFLDLEHGFSKQLYLVEKQDNEPKILTNFEVKSVSNPIDEDYDYSSWKKCETSTDSLVNEIYGEFSWYKAQIPNTLEEITLSARHLFGVYINGKEVLNRNSYKLEKLQQIPETITIGLDKNILTKTNNELTIFVQNLGFDKGFSNDTNLPRGLVSFVASPSPCRERAEVVGEAVPNLTNSGEGACVEFFVKEGIDFDEKESENSYLTKLSTTFEAKKQENIFAPMYLELDLEKFKHNRATIFLNGVKIGRYLRSTASKSPLQTKFYLIDTFLKNGQNSLDIIIWDKERNIASPWGFKSELKHVIIEIGNKKTFQLF